MGNVFRPLLRNEDQRIPGGKRFLPNELMDDEEERGARAVFHRADRGGGEEQAVAVRRLVHARIRHHRRIRDAGDAARTEEGQQQRGLDHEPVARTSREGLRAFRAEGMGGSREREHVLFLQIVPQADAANADGIRLAVPNPASEADADREQEHAAAGHRVELRISERQLFHSTLQEARRINAAGIQSQRIGFYTFEYHFRFLSEKKCFCPSCCYSFKSCHFY